MSFFGRWFGKPDLRPASPPPHTRPAEQVQRQPERGVITADPIIVARYGEHVVGIDSLDLIGQAASSPNGRFTLVWCDGNPEGTMGGHRYSGHGRVLLVDGERLVADVRAERPNDGKVADIEPAGRT